MSLLVLLEAFHTKPQFESEAKKGRLVGGISWQSFAADAMKFSGDYLGL